MEKGLGGALVSSTIPLGAAAHRQSVNISKIESENYTEAAKRNRKWRSFGN
jgi:hypothetical protein